MRMRKEMFPMQFGGAKAPLPEAMKPHRAQTPRGNFSGSLEGVGDRAYIYSHLIFGNAWNKFKKGAFAPLCASVYDITSEAVIQV